MKANPEITYEEFEKVDIRTGTIVEVEEFPEARKPAWKLTIDFGSHIGLKRSSAQITAHYKKEDLIGKQVMAIVNFSEKSIAGFKSQVLVLGFSDTSGHIVLARPDTRVPNGHKLH